MLTVMPRLTLLATLAIASACGDKPVGVTVETDADYNHTELEQAVDKFVAAGRTPEAYQQFAKTVLSLRQGMDHTVAREAELRLVVLALGPVASVKTQSMPEQVEALALTVWPTLLQPTFEEDAVLIKRDPKAALLQPLPEEDARVRTCSDCAVVRSRASASRSFPSCKVRSCKRSPRVARWSACATPSLNVRRAARSRDGTTRFASGKTSIARCTDLAVRDRTPW